MFKTLTSFFRLYFHTLTGNKGKKEEIALDDNEHMTAVVTPLIFMILHGLLSFIFPVITLGIFAWMIMGIANAIYIFTIREKVKEAEYEMEEMERKAKRERERREYQKHKEEYRRRHEEYERKKREKERLEELLRRERERRAYREAEQWFEEYMEGLNRQREREAREKEKRAKAKQEWEGSYYGYSYDEYGHRQQRSKYSYEYDRPSSKPKVDQNIINAMNLLQIKEGYTKEDVKKAYKKMAKVHHPDCGGLPENFKKLKTAYDYIMARI